MFYKLITLRYNKQQVGVRVWLNLFKISLEVELYFIFECSPLVCDSQFMAASVLQSHYGTNRLFLEFSLICRFIRV